MLATILKNQLLLCERLSMFPEEEAQCFTAHAIRFPKTRLLILLRLLWRTSFVWDAEVVVELLFSFSSYFSRLLSTNSTQYKSCRVEIKMANSKQTYRGKNRAFILFFDAVFCCLIQVQHRIRKKNGNSYIMKLSESCHK